MKSIVRLLVGGIAFGASVLSAEVASAAYACEIRHMPSTSGTYGNVGYAYVTVYTAANCGGSYVGGYFICTTGATSTLCPSSTLYRYSEPGLLTHVSNLVTAIREGQAINVVEVTCTGGAASDCFGYMYYRP